MTAIVRYVASDAIRSQRWVAPVVVFAAFVAIANSNAGPMLTTYADTVAVLFPIAIWLSWAILGAEDPVQVEVSIVTVGSDIRYRVGKLLTCLVGGAILSAVAVAVPVAVAIPSATGGRGIATDAVAGLFAHLFVVLFAVGVGALTSRPVIRRSGWAFYAAILVIVADIALAHAPPVRQLLSLLDADHPRHLASSLAVTGVETAALTAAAVALAMAVARRRS
ncbi:MAG TPA: hypothetical protein VHT30_06320 [Acidimicrobiales bacterium]|jgi:hypothetical protein|nr:hypothetical protein [Acidimicrobiales bacterium]